MKKVILFTIITMTIIGIKPLPTYAETIICNQNTLLQKGSQNEQVKILQWQLNKAIKCNLEIDGIFGPLTEKCTKKFQKKYNLEIDGIVGPETCTKLNSVYRITNTTAIPSATKSKNYKYIIIAPQNANVRNAISLTDSSIVTTLTQGRTLRTYGTETVDGITWYRIIGKTNNKTTFLYIQDKDITTSAIVIDTTTQKLTFYKNQKIIMTAPIISGTKNKNDTPKGKYEIDPNNIIRNVFLRNENQDGLVYNAYANYWIPFIPEKGIGFNDAFWRNDEEYNKQTFLQQGSNGSINMKLEDITKLYENITAPTTVIVK